MRYFIVTVLFAAIGAFLPGCNFNDPRSVARIRVFNASPDIGGVDVTLNDEVEMDNLTFGEGTGYSSVLSGVVMFLVKKAGGGGVLVDEGRAAEARKFFTYVIFGFSHNLGTELFLDDLELDKFDKAELRVINLSPTIGPVDVFVSPPGGDIGTLSPDIAGLGLAEASTNLRVPLSTEQRIRVTPADSKTVLVDSGTVSFNLGQIRTVVILDAPGGGAPFSLVFLADKG